MSEETRVAVFEGGELRIPAKARKGGEAVLAVPFSRLVAAIVRAPSEGGREALLEAATPVLKAASPFPDESPAVSCEVLRETEDGTVALAATLPEDSTEDLGAALDEAKLDITAVDAISLGVLRTQWSDISGDGRRMALVCEKDCIGLFVFDGDCPVAARAVSRGGDFARDARLTLLKAEDFAGGAPFAGTVVIGEPGESVDAALEAFGPVKRVPLREGAAEAGVAARAADGNALNVLPDSWRDVLEETRFKRKARKWLSAAGAVWMLVVAAMAGGPYVYGYMTSRQETVRRQHRSAYNKVNEKKLQVEAVRLVSNHDLGALESLRVAASVMPESILLNKWNFKRGEKLVFSGTAEDGDQQKVYNFKDGLAGVMLSQISGDEKDGDTPFFTGVTLPRGVVQRGSKTVFDMECSFKTAEGD